MLITEQEEYLNAVLEWGKTHLLSPTIELYLKELEEYCGPLVESDELVSFLSNSIEEVQKQVESATTILSSDELIMATDEDFIWHEAQASFIAFDRVNYLMEAVRYLLFPSKGEEYNKIISKLDNVFLRITSWLEEGDFSPLRLTSINDIRQHYLKQIPENERYQFPWYESYCDYDENVLEIIAENLDVFFSKSKIKQIAEIPKIQLIEISYELKRDSKLFSRLKQEFAFHKDLMAAVSKRSGFRLWRLGDNSSLDYILPRRVEKVGPERVSINILKDATNYTKEDDAYWSFMQAFCGPGLEDKKRLELLDKVEELVKEINVTNIVDEDKTRVLSTLKLWFEGKCEDSELVKESFGTWIRLMEEKAKYLRVMEFDEETGKLLKVLNTLLEGSVYGETDPKPKPVIKEELVSILDNFLEWIGTLISPQPKLQAALAMPMGEETKKIEEGTFELEGAKLTINVSLRPNAKGRYCFLTKPEQVSSCDSEKDYDCLWNYIGSTTGNYWGGCVITEYGKPEIFPTKEAIGQIFHKVESNNYKNAIIGISDNKEDIDKFVQLLNKLGSVDDIKVDKHLNVVVLIISFVK